MADSRKNLSFINYAYAIGAIFVVLGHSTPTSASNVPIIVDQIRSFIYCFHMPLFFFIAGLLMQYTKSESRPPYLSFIGKKSVKFLVPYFVYTIIGFLPKIFLARFTNDSVSFSFEYLFKTFFSPRDNVWGHFWFLPTLLIVYLFSYFLLDMNKHKPIILTITVCAAALAVFPIPTDWVCLHDLSEMLVFFVLGIVLGDFVVKSYDRIFKLPFALLSTIVSIAIFAAYILCFYSENGYDSNIYEAVKLIVGCLMIYTVLTFSVLFARYNNKLLTLLNGKTFSIYLMSWPCQAFAEIALNRVLHLHWIIVILGMFTVGLAVPLFVVWIYKKLSGKSKVMNCLLGLN